MKAKEGLEVRRQLFHLVLGSAIALAVWFLKPLFGSLILLPLAAAVVILLLLPKLAPKLHASNHLLRHFERRRDIKRFPYKGAVFYGIGIFFPILLLQVELACLIIVILSVGDAMSTLVGKFHGKMKVGDKTLEGTLAFFVFGVLGCLLFLTLIGRMDLAKTALGLTLAGALVELQSMVDDNLAVPLVLSVVLGLAGW